MSKTASNRLNGLDLARFFALVGMIIVNFKVAMNVGGEGPGWAGHLSQALEGRAAATFVVLAGIGLGLAYGRDKSASLTAVTLKRAALLMVLGLLNSLVFPADILHYYAVYFVLALACLNLSMRQLLALIVALPLAFLALVFLLDYEAGWNWETLDYEGFWTPVGFVRNLFFNGWHPVVPWFGFFVLGLVLARLDLAKTITQYRLIAFGLMLWTAAEVLSFLLLPLATGEWAELRDLALTSPVPPGPLYMMAGSGVAMVVIALCLRAAPALERIGVLGLLAPAGRQTLTLYIAHIVIGMGTLEALGWLNGQSVTTALYAALVFCALATLYAWAWSHWFKRGPLEALMRRVAG